MQDSFVKNQDCQTNVTPNNETVKTWFLKDHLPALTIPEAQFKPLGIFGGSVFPTVIYPTQIELKM